MNSTYIKEKDVFHGPVLKKIVDHKSYTALNQLDKQYGHYLVNKDIRLWVKYSGSSDAPWTFTFQPRDLRAVNADLGLSGLTFVVLACGNQTICCLSADEVHGLVDLDSTSVQWIKVDVKKGQQMRITGSMNNNDPLLAPHNKFPNCIF